MQKHQNPYVNSTDMGRDYPDREPNNIEDVPPRDRDREGDREPLPLPADVEDPYPVVDPPLDEQEPRVAAN